MVHSGRSQMVDSGGRNKVGKGMQELEEAKQE
jgi:hypothetical protein